MGKAPGQD